MEIDKVRSVSSSKSDEIALLEATATSLKSMEHLVNLASEKNMDHQIHPKQLSNNIIAPLKRAISISSTQTGHALFRHAPIQQHNNQIPSSTLSLQMPLCCNSEKCLTGDPTKVKDSNNASDTSFPFFTPIPGDATVSKNIDTSNSASLISPTRPESSVGKPSLPVKRSCEHDQFGGLSRKIRKTIRVEATGPKAADVPSDAYSWRKYGQKPIKASPYPRGYYKCSCVKDCPAKKHVERATDDPNMLIVTYKDEHNHNQAKQDMIAPPSAGTSMVPDST